MPSATRLTAALLIIFSLVSSAHARPAHKQALGDHYGPYLAKKQHDCRMCHVPEPPGTPTDVLAEDKPHNPFGKRLKAARDELRKAGKKGTIAERLALIADEDSDGDGVTNQVEILAGRFPGDANDKPTEDEIAEGKKALLAFAKFQSGYPWRPYEVVQRPATPPPPPSQVGEQWRIRNPIDAFIAAEHQARGLTPRPEAPKHVLLRRVYLDLIGLPPTREELQAFLSDDSSDAYEKVAERLLQDRRYGERWGRHWMDIWRYSDWAGWTGGNQIRDSQPHIWRWRDWIVESLNQDKSYDRMILEMLAADEIAPEDEGALRATGYLVRNYKMLSRETWMQETVDHTFQAFLGTTIGCARCHDHMFDPILQKEYYQVRAIFEPHNVRTDRIPGQADVKKDGLVRAFDAQLDAKTYLFVRGDDRHPDKSKELTPGVPEALSGKFPSVEAVKLPPLAVCPDKRDFVIAETLQASEAAVKQATTTAANARRAMLLAAVQTLEASPLGTLGRIAGAKKAGESLTQARLDEALARAKDETLRAVIKADLLEDQGKKPSSEWHQAATAATQAQRIAAVLEARKNLLVAQQTERVQLDDVNLAVENATAEVDLPPGNRPFRLPQSTEPPKTAAARKALAQAEANLKQPPTTNYVKRPVQHYPTTSTGRRLAFARWIADTQNPLTARVAMNHIWLRHFGQALVPSVFDFGRNGRWPTHPALLDWLAAEFMEPTIPSPPHAKGATTPPPLAKGGQGGWSMKHMHRLIVTSSSYRMASTPDAKNAELDRDNVYLWRMPSRRLEAEVVRDSVFYVAGKLDPAMGGPDIDYNQGLTLPRRSLYFRHAQEKQMEFLKLFDCAAVTECYQRKDSVLPQQALALANSQMVRQHARILGRALSSKHGEAREFTIAAFEQVLNRAPSEAELAECVAFLQRQTERFAKDPQKPLADKGDGSQPSPDPSLRAREDLVHVLLNHHDFVTIR